MKSKAAWIFSSASQIARNGIFSAAAGFDDTLLRWKMKPEVVNGKKKDIYLRAQNEAVKLVVERGPSGQRLGRSRERAAQVGGVSCGRSLRGAFPGSGKQKAQDAEIARLQKEVAKLKMERDISKKAAAYFAKESM